MKIFRKEQKLGGWKYFYFCGVKVWSTYRQPSIPDFSYDVMKFKGLQRANNIENIILGSSHGRDGFVPRVGDYNLSNSSQDLYRACKLYEYTIKHKNKHIKNVILFWSVFHPGLQLERTKNFQMCVPYKALYGIDYACEFPTDDAPAINKINQLMQTIECPDDFYGQSMYNINHNAATPILVDKHVKNTTRNNNQIQYLEQIVQNARKNKHNVYIVLPPYRSDYLAHLPKDTEIFSELYLFLEQNPDIVLINLQNDTDFLDSDFESADHCNVDGGLKLTAKIKSALKKC